MFLNPFCPLITTFDNPRFKKKTRGVHGWMPLARPAFPPNDTLEFMDKVRFGRAIGEGIRHAAKSLTKALAAAAAPDPASKTSSAPRPTSHAPLNRSPQASTPAKSTQSGALLAPVKRLSRTVWLEVTGTFFALIAVSMARGVWIYHVAIHASPRTSDAQKLYAFAIMFLLFAYFALSSFIRARRASRPAAKPAARR